MLCMEVAGVFNSPGRKAGDRSANRAFCKSIPGLPAWAITELNRNLTVKPVQTSSESIGVTGSSANGSRGCRIGKLAKVVCGF